jgi:flagella basal body P-ring formation protein FlgA
MRRSIGLVLAALLAGAPAAPAGEPPAPGRPLNQPQALVGGGDVLISLFPMILAQRPAVYVEDVASLEGGDLQQRRLLGRLDLLDLPGWGGEVTISREQVRYRLLLAGVGPARFRLVGAAAVHVRQAPHLADSAVVAAAHRQPAPGVLPPRLREGPPVVVHKRDSVRLRLYVGSLQVTTRGEALEDGRAGERIRIRNVDSSRVVSGRVVDRGTVEVTLDGDKP